MRNFCLAVVVLSAAAPLFAAQHSVELGYSRSDIGDGDHLNGGNVKYGYQPDDSALGLITSVTLTGDSDKNKQDGVKTDGTLGYGSLMVGATYQLTDWLKPYAMAGVGRAGYKIDVSYEGNKETIKDHDTALAYGAGIQIEPVKNIFIDLGYEGSRLFDTQVNTFTAGAGYRF